jgi:hypothetical protein
MKPGEYIVAGFVFLMLATFFGVFFWFQLKRIKNRKTASHNREESNV